MVGLRLVDERSNRDLPGHWIAHRQRFRVSYEALCRDPNVAMIQFTGSTAAGRMVGKTASENLKKVSLELGGKNSLIVLEDADLELAAKNASWASYLHQGQICMSAGPNSVAPVSRPETVMMADIAMCSTNGRAITMSIGSQMPY